jgi:hypothetical protein
LARKPQRNIPEYGQKNKINAAFKPSWPQRRIYFPTLSVATFQRLPGNKPTDNFYLGPMLATVVRYEHPPPSF